MKARCGRAARFVVAGAILWGCSGCATYGAKLADLRPQLADGQFEAALETVEQGAGGKDRLLYHLERGLVLHYAERPAESIESFALAEQLADELYTKSISEGALSLITNDESISYRARPFEMAQVPYYQALNYILLGQPQEALVEARRASQLQARFVEATLAGLREEDRSDLQRIGTDPFLLYFSGMLYDWGGETNDAFTAYRNAAVAYEDLAGLLAVDVPPALAGDLERTALRLGFGEELASARKDCPAVFAAAGDPGTREPDGGEVVLFLEAGYVPQKRQVRFDFPIFSGEPYHDHAAWAWQIETGMGNVQAFSVGRKIEYWVSIAAPELADDAHSPLSRCRIASLDGTGTAVTARAANLARQARITFDAEKPSIMFKTILRGLTKYLASRQVKKSAGTAAGLLANIFGAAVEKADTRCWLTLPEAVHLGRLRLPAGRHDLKIELLDGRGRVYHTEVIEGVEVAPGGWTFLSRRIF